MSDVASSPVLVPLASLRPGAQGTVMALGPDGVADDVHPVAARLRELGVREGAPFVLRHTGPLGRDPMAVEVQGVLLALRRRDAALMWVEVAA